MDAAAELGRDPVSKHYIQPEYGDEQADAGRDCRTRLAGPNSQARRGHFPVQLTTSRIGSLTRLIHTLAICVTVHACIHMDGGDRKIDGARHPLARGQTTWGARLS